MSEGPKGAAFHPPVESISQGPSCPTWAEAPGLNGRAEDLHGVEKSPDSTMKYRIRQAIIAV